MNAALEKNGSPVTHYTLRVVPLAPLGSLADTQIMPLSSLQSAWLERAMSIEFWLSQGFDVIEKESNPWVWEIQGELDGVPTRWKFEIVFETLSLN